MNEGGLGAYVHVPFCGLKCFYCDFTAFAGQGAQRERYVEAVGREAGLYPRQAPATLYVGGGTPTELSASQLARLLGLLAERLGPLERMAEVTVEANPESCDPGKLSALRRAGATRLSLGLQTAQDELLAAAGRRHGFAEFALTFRAARELGFDLGVDLMLGLPGQGAAQAAESLERVLELAPEHVSVYCLQVEDRTLFAKRGVAPDDALVRAMWEAAIERLSAAGFRHYEISNFARPGKESRHNLNYWRDGEYLGLGCGASGFLGGERYQNEDRLVPYLERVARGERPVASAERLEGKARLGEALMLGLRRVDGLAPDAGQAAAFARELEGLARRGLIERPGGGRVRLTREGLFHANEAFRAFVAPFDVSIGVFENLPLGDSRKAPLQGTEKTA